MAVENEKASNVTHWREKSRKSPAFRSPDVRPVTAEDRAAVKVVCNWLNDEAHRRQDSNATLARGLRTLAVQVRNFVDARGSQRRNLRHSILRSIVTISELQQANTTRGEAK